MRAGTELAHTAVDTLDRIAGMVDDAAMAVKEISVATQQQRSASDQVVVAMTRADEVSRQYAAASRQAASSAGELAGLADDLRGSIDQFSVERTDEPYGRPLDPWAGIEGSAAGSAMPTTPEDLSDEADDGAASSDEVLAPST